MCESQHQHFHLPTNPPEAHLTPSIFWRAENSHKLHTSHNFPRFSFQALPSMAPRDELILPCRSWRPLDSGWKLILGDQAFSSLTSLPDLESGKSEQWYLPTTSVVSLLGTGFEGHFKAGRASHCSGGSSALGGGSKFTP